MTELSIIIPAKNEALRIGQTLKEYITFFDQHFKKDYEIWVIINNCKDNTQDVVRNFSNKHKQVNYKYFQEQIGKGGAIIEGFKLAQGNYIGFVDADCSTPPRAFHDLYKNIGQANGIIASRWMKGANIAVKQPFSRRFVGRGFNFLVRLLFNLQVSDTQCGAKLFTKDAIHTVHNKLGTTQWAFDLDLLYLMKRHGYPVKEIPTEWNDSLGSKLKMHKVIPEMFLSIVRLRLLYSPLKFLEPVLDKFFWRFMKR